jgi:hypothetical protein
MLSLNAPASSLLLSQTSSDIRFGDRNPALLRTDIAGCWLRNECSVQLIITQLGQVVTQWNTILFQLFYGWTIYLFTDQSVYFCISNTDEIITPLWSFDNEASQFQCKFWEKHDITVQPVITYMCLCVQWYAASLLSFFKPSNWNVRQAWENLYTIGILSYMDCWCLLPFSSNISCNCSRKVRLFWQQDINGVQHIRHCITAAGYTARKFCYKARHHN